MEAIIRRSVDSSDHDEDHDPATDDPATDDLATDSPAEPDVRDDEDEDIVGSVESRTGPRPAPSDDDWVVPTVITGVAVVVVAAVAILVAVLVPQPQPATILDPEVRW